MEASSNESSDSQVVSKKQNETSCGKSEAEVAELWKCLHNLESSVSDKAETVRRFKLVQTYRSKV